MKKIRFTIPADKANIARSISYLKMARSLLQEVKALKAAAAISRAIKSAEGAYRHAERALQSQARENIKAYSKLRQESELEIHEESKANLEAEHRQQKEIVKWDPINQTHYFAIDTGDPFPL